MPLEGLPTTLFWIAWAAAIVLTADAVRRAQWNAPLREHAMWAATTAMILLGRQMTITLPGGMSLQYLGAAWLTLLLGYPRAVVSLVLISLVDALQFERSFAAQGLTLLLLGIAPAWLMWAIAHVCKRKLPPNLFVFLLGVGFIGLFVAYAIPLLAAAALGAMTLASAPPEPGAANVVAMYWNLVLPYALLLAAGEAWLEGMLTTLLVVFAPGAVRLFDEAHYLSRR